MSLLGEALRCPTHQNVPRPTIELVQKETGGVEGLRTPQECLSSHLLPPSTKTSPIILSLSHTKHRAKTGVVQNKPTCVQNAKTKCQKAKRTMQKCQKACFCFMKMKNETMHEGEGAVQGVGWGQGVNLCQVVWHAYVCRPTSLPACLVFAMQSAAMPMGVCQRHQPVSMPCTHSKTLQIIEKGMEKEKIRQKVMSSYRWEVKKFQVGEKG